MNLNHVKSSLDLASKARASSSSALDIVISTEDLSSIPDRVEAKGNITIFGNITIRPRNSRTCFPALPGTTTTQGHAQHPNTPPAVDPPHSVPALPQGRGGDLKRRASTGVGVGRGAGLRPGCGRPPLQRSAGG